MENSLQINIIFLFLTLQQVHYILQINTLRGVLDFVVCWNLVDVIEPVQWEGLGFLAIYYSMDLYTQTQMHIQTLTQGQITHFSFSLHWQILTLFPPHMPIITLFSSYYSPWNFDRATSHSKRNMGAWKICYIYFCRFNEKFVVLVTHLTSAL